MGTKVVAEVQSWKNDIIMNYPLLDSDSLTWGSKNETLKGMTLSSLSYVEN